VASRTPRAAAASGKPHWLIEMTLGGTVHRHSDEAVDVTTSAGVVVHYLPGLQDAPKLHYAIGAGSPHSIAITLTGTGVDWAALAAEGQDLTTGLCTVRRWFEGQTLEAARIITSTGVLDAPSYGTIEEPLIISVQNFPWVDGGLMPASAAVVSGTTWPVRANQATDDTVVGKFYPIIIGRPGLYSPESAISLFTGLAAACPTSPAWPVELGGVFANDGGVIIGGATDLAVSRWVVADGEVRATSCRMYDTSSTGSVTASGYYTVVLGADKLGRPVSYVQADSVVSASGGLSSRWAMPHAGGTYSVAWTEGGGLYNADRTGLLNGAGEIIAYLFATYSTVPLNAGLMQSARAQLDAYRIDCFIADQTKPYDWVMSHLAPLIPMGWVETGTGGYFQFFDFGATVTQAIAHLDADAEAGQVVRSSPITYTPRADVCNAWTLQFAWDERQGSYQRTMTLDNTASPTADSGSSYLCAISQSRHGRSEKVLQTTVIYDEATARLILSNLARRYAIQRRQVSYACSQGWESLMMGDIVTLTDSALYLSNVVAMVAAIEIADFGVEVTLTLLDNPDNASKRVV